MNAATPITDAELSRLEAHYRAVMTYQLKCSENMPTDEELLGAANGIALIANLRTAREQIARLESMGRHWLEHVDQKGKGTCCGCDYSETTEETRALLQSGAPS